MKAEHTKNDSRAGLDKPREISSYPNQIPHTIETRKIRKRSVKCRVTIHLRELLRGENAELDQVRPIGRHDTVSRQFDHARRDIASEDREFRAAQDEGRRCQCRSLVRERASLAQKQYLTPARQHHATLSNRGFSEGARVGLRQPRSNSSRRIFSDESIPWLHSSRKCTHKESGEQKPDPPCHSTGCASRATENRFSNGCIIVTAPIRSKLAAVQERRPVRNARCPAPRRVLSN